MVTKAGYDVDLLISTLLKLHQRYPNLRIILEPGSAFAWQTGYLASRVVDIVENKGIKTAILNVSFTCHMPDCLEMPYWPKVRNAETLENFLGASDAGNVYRLGGNSCLSGDYMGSWKFDAPLKVGDAVIFEDMIHYTTVKTTMFNGISHPALAMVHETTNELEILREYGPNDYIERMD